MQLLVNLFVFSVNVGKKEEEAIEKLNCHL